ncbi:hypothetical protein CBM2609_A170077 [Cupriavidus taiwanensis]|nr:hypothetical protein CBM2609_A170077 [Cupriavidus taiwanensis]
MSHLLFPECFPSPMPLMHIISGWMSSG